MRSYIKLIITLLLQSFLIPEGLSQNLDLFQALESGNSEKENVRRPQTSVNTGATTITLKGVNRFGDRYFVSLEKDNNERFATSLPVNGTSSIKDLPGYSIVDVKFRTVTLTYPESAGCSEMPSKGVKCNGPYMLLSMTSGEPIEQRLIFDTDTPKGDRSADQDSILQETDTEDGRFFRNPFSGEMQEIPDLSPEELARRDERRGRRAEMFRDFEIVRIPDEDIPEGMQRIRTPFGDSLEPIGSD